MSYSISARQTARLAGGAAGLLIALGVSAQEQAVQPHAIVVFSGVGVAGEADPGDKPGRWMRMPPTLGPDGKLHGMTAGSSYFKDSRWFSVAADGQGYTVRQPDDVIAMVAGPLVSTGQGSAGKLFGSTGTAAFEMVPGQAAVKLEPATPAGEALKISSLSSAMAAGADGSVFFGGRTSNTNPQVWRRLAAGGFELVADFGRPEYVVSKEIIPGISMVDKYLKGDSTIALVWSEADQALYGVTEDVSSTGKNGDAQTVPGDKPAGTIYRIKASGFKADGSSPIEILHTFAASRDGAAKSLTYRAPALLEVGEWLYGTTTAGTKVGNANDKQDGRIWRMRKDCVSTAESSCLEIVYRFDTAGVLTAANGGALPLGPLVYAADGNVYGTTFQGGKDATSEQNGQGTLFRIANPTAAKLEDVEFAQLHAFDASSTGSRPSGLALATKADGKQTIVGVTEFGGNASDTYNAVDNIGTGFGTVFAFEVALPAAAITRFQADGSQAAKVAEGSKVTLAWASSGASVCEAGGDWSGAQQTEGSAQVGPLAYRAEPYRYTLVCQSADGAASQEQAVTVSVEQKAVTPEPGEESGAGNEGKGGGGGSLPWQALALLPLALLRQRLRAARKETVLL